MPDASFLFSLVEDDMHVGRKRRAGSRDINLQEDFTNSQFLGSGLQLRDPFADEELALEPMDGIDLGLDFSLELDDFARNDRSVEVGRDAPAARGMEDDLLSEIDIAAPPKDPFADRENSLNLDFVHDNEQIAVFDEDADMNIGDELDVTALPAAPLPGRGRLSESPLSDIDDAVVRNIEAEHDRTLASVFEPEEETEQSIFREPARARKQRMLQPDLQSMIPTKELKARQQSHDYALQPQTFLPRDSNLLALMEMQRNGGFVSNVMGEGRSAGWAPELRGMLSLDTIRKSGELKRKRDNIVENMDIDQDENNARKSPRLDLGEEDELTLGLGNDILGQDESTLHPADNTIMEMAGHERALTEEHDQQNNYDPASPRPNFDETHAPLVHPADSGPVSLGTKHAVHLLRDRFGAEAENSPDKRNKASVLFQDLLPAATTSKADATKMFFEVLVLATKDAVKVEQQEDKLGGPIRVRGKRGLWGAWAEREAGGEIEQEEEEEVVEDAQNVVAIPKIV